MPQNLQDYFLNLSIIHHYYNLKNLDKIVTQLVVIGSGPGGYTAAFRAADLGLKVVIIEKNNNLGGVCLNRGCIPSKAFLHLSHIINESKKIKNMGVEFNEPKIKRNKIKSWKESIVNNLSNGIENLAKQRNVEVINGKAEFYSAKQLIVTDKQNKKVIIEFDNCIIASGSSPSLIKNIDVNSPLIINSTKALDMESIPKKLLIIGGGYIGLELGTVYHSFGSEITIAEFFPNLLSMADQDLVKPLQQELENKFKNIYLSTEVQNLDPKTNNVIATFKQNKKIFKNTYDMVLICIGRTPNTKYLHLDKAGIRLDKNGFIPVNKKQRTIIPNIYAIGDVIGNPMLAHKATHEGKIAAENIAGKDVIFDPITIPSVIYTNPEIAWAGFTENELKEKNIQYNKALFPWAASGRAMTNGTTNGKTKILSSKDNDTILGIGIVGTNAGELISEAVLAMEMGANIEDISLTIHPHPTLSETIANTSEILTKTITDLYIRSKESK